jgi:hypothetical protein
VVLTLEQLIELLTRAVADGVAAAIAPVAAQLEKINGKLGEGHDDKPWDGEGV